MFRRVSTSNELNKTEQSVHTDLANIEKDPLIVCGREIG